MANQIEYETIEPKADPTGTTGGYYTIYVPETQDDKKVVTRHASYIRVGLPNTSAGGIDGKFFKSDTVPPDGIALYTEGAYKLKAASVSQTVLGESFSELYDVDAPDKSAAQANIDDGKPQLKQLITAIRTRRESPGMWRTTKYDTGKTLNYSFADNGSFSIASNYAFAAGLRFNNYVSGSFDSFLTKVEMPLLKVEIGDKRCETSGMLGKLTYGRVLNDRP
jgi:hypothetical protein